MRIALFTDLHGNLPALKAILADLKKEAVDQVYSLGDAIAIGPQGKEVLDLLIAKGVIMLRGNHETYYLRREDPELIFLHPGEKTHQKWVSHQLGPGYHDLLQSLPYEITLTHHGITLHLSHYPQKSPGDYHHFLETRSPEAMEKLYGQTKADLYFCGHDHRFFDGVHQDGRRRYVVLGAAGAHKGPFTRYAILSLGEWGYDLCHKRLYYPKEEVFRVMDDLQMPERKFIKTSFYGEE